MVRYYSALAVKPQFTGQVIGIFPRRRAESAEPEYPNA